MKQNTYYLMISLMLFSPAIVLANPPTSLGYIDATIGVKNNTKDSINVSCRVGVTNQGDYTLGGPQTITAGGAYTFMGKAGDGCSVSMQGSVSNSDTDVVCDYTDNTTGNTGTFILGACQNLQPFNWKTNPYIDTYTNNISVYANGEPPTPYTCPVNSADYSTTNASFQCSNGNMSQSYSTCKVEAYFAVSADSFDSNTYRFTWDEVDLPSTKGQIMADKLVRSLSDTGHYGKVTGSYDKPNKKITIKLPPPDPTDPNPYEGMTSLSQCRDACVPSQ